MITQMLFRNILWREVQKANDRFVRLFWDYAANPRWEDPVADVFCYYLQHLKAGILIASEESATVMEMMIDVINDLLTAVEWGRDITRVHGG